MAVTESSPQSRTITLRTLGSTELVDENDEPLHLQPKRLALLVYLALEASAKTVARDSLLALFWPRRSEGSARAALRQALYYLGEEVGIDLVETRGWNEVGFHDVHFRCDAADLLHHVQLGDSRKAFALYHGEFLKGFHYQDASRSFESWIAGTRSRLRSCAVEAAVELAEVEETRGDHASELRWLEQALDLAPFDESLLRRLIALHLEVGDRPSAVTLYRDFIERVAIEYGEDASPELHRLMEADLGSPGVLASPNLILRSSNAALRRRNADLERRNRLLESLLDRCDSGIAVLDDGLHVVRWSRRAEEIWEVESREAIGRPWSSLELEVSDPSLEVLLTATASGEDAPHEVVWTGIDRRGRTVRCRARVLPSPPDDLSGKLIVMEAPLCGTRP